MTVCPRGPGDDTWSEEEWSDLCSDPPKSAAERARIRAELDEFAVRFGWGSLPDSQVEDPLQLDMPF